MLSKNKIPINIFSAIIGALLLTSCSKSNFDDDIALDNHFMTVPTDNWYPLLLDQARWGDGKAYLRLAEYHHDVSHDFLCFLSMLALAEQYGGINSLEDYFGHLPTGDNAKMFYDAIECFDGKDFHGASEIIERMISDNFLDGYTLKGFFFVEQGDTLEGKRFVSLAAGKGSALANLLLAAFPNWDGSENPSAESLTPLAESIPLACKLLGDLYAGVDGQEFTNEELAAKFYKKADELGFLGKRAARWLWEYYKRNNIDVGEREMNRLAILGGTLDFSDGQENVSSQQNDTIMAQENEPVIFNNP